MRRRVAGLLLIVALAVGAMAAPAAAAGCKANGSEMAAIGRSGQGEPVMSAGEVWSAIAKSRSHPEVEDGPGVLARYLHLQMDDKCPEG